MSGTVAIVPVKIFAQAKSRLRKTLDDQTRLALIHAMVADVLAALAEAREIVQTIVVTSEPDVSVLAERVNALVVDDAAASTHSEAASLGVAAAIKLGAQRVLLAPGDCPLLNATELDRFLSSTPLGPPERPQVTVMPDRHLQGTNGLLISPPLAISPAFGSPSLDRHINLACDCGANVSVARLRSFEFDADTAEDLKELTVRLDPRSNTGQVLMPSNPSVYRRPIVLPAELSQARREPSTTDTAPTLSSR